MAEIPPDEQTKTGSGRRHVPLPARGGATRQSRHTSGATGNETSIQPPTASSIPGRGRGSSGESRPAVSNLSQRGRGNTRSYHYPAPLASSTRSGLVSPSVNMTPTVEPAGAVPQASGQAQQEPEAAPAVPFHAPNSIPLEQSSASRRDPTQSRPELLVPPSVPPKTVRDVPHPQWYIRCTLYMIAFLHTRHRVTFRAAALMLVCLGFLFSCLAGDFTKALAMPRTLKTVFAHLEISENFVVHPICTECHFVFEPNEAPEFCPDCNEEVFVPRDGAHSDMDDLQGAATADSGDNFDHPESGKRKPFMVSPIQSLSVGLQEFFKRPGMVATVNSWKTRSEVDGELRSIQDGHVWKAMKDKQGRPFFYGPHAEDEIRLGVSFSLDRYRTANCILSAMTGRKEPTAEQLQKYLKLIIDDLIVLYEDGIVIKTPEYPDRKRVRVVLVAIIADHPAMLTKEDFFTEESLRNEFPPRSGEEHRRLSKVYNDLSTPEEKKEFFETYGVRWTGFARLDYFDLGVAKTQWFTRWIETGALRSNIPQTARELNIVHKFLQSFEAPLWAGRLPLRVGEAAGGSLTADEYKFATTAPWTVVIPLVWERFSSEAEKDYEHATVRYPTSLGEYKKKLKVWEAAPKAGNTNARKPREPKAPFKRMQPGEDRNFLRFATALKILVGSSIRIEGLDRAKQLLEDYLLGFSELYGRDQMKPNHHWAVHVPDQALDYGPLHNFWAFLPERLNKVLKNLNSNNWGGGLLEVSTMREFQRMTQLEGMLNGALDETSGENVPAELQTEHRFIRYLLGSEEDREAVGTIQDAATH
ncbi:hypothetical protein C8R45DRAFT_1208644 [Mycena sanguinolenta]|nr:hypothetical protein C8R45DRAFT_1208644 [Mycena sanguinolenta]